MPKGLKSIKIYSKFCKKKILFVKECRSRVKFCKIFPSLFTCLAQKMLKKYFSTNVWSAQHPNSGWNIQQSNHEIQWLCKFLVSKFWASLIIRKFCAPCPVCSQTLRLWTPLLVSFGQFSSLDDIIWHSF